MPFSKLGLSDALLRAVAEQGYTEPTPIQAQAIPAVLAGGDLLAGAQTGTGKTAGFVLPMLQRLSTQPSPYKSHGARKPLRALILTPTRELAAQIEESIRTYGKHLKVSSMVLFGGVGFAPQAAQLKRGVDMLVATPGRLLDHHGQGNIDFSYVEIFVLDEADRMLDMGFIPDVKRVLALLPKKRQNLLFSATFSDDIKALADRLLDRPQTIEVAPRNSTVDAIAQRVHPVDRDRKRELLSFLIGQHQWKQVLVFTRTKHGADKLARALESDGIHAVALHGNKSQGARTRALADFKNGVVEVLVATDIAARGIDIDQLPHVVNYDLPNVPEDYVHRIGRTGRAGNEGEAISLVCIDEKDFLRDIERLIKREIPSQVIDGFQPDPKAVAQPVFAQRGQGRGQARGQGQGRGQSKTASKPAGQRQPQPRASQSAQRGAKPQDHSQRASRAANAGVADNAGQRRAPAGGAPAARGESARARNPKHVARRAAGDNATAAHAHRQGLSRPEANGNGTAESARPHRAEADGNARAHASQRAEVDGNARRHPSERGEANGNANRHASTRIDADGNGAFHGNPRHVAAEANGNVGSRDQPRAASDRKPGNAGARPPKAGHAAGVQRNHGTNAGAPRHPSNGSAPRHGAGRSAQTPALFTRAPAKVR